MLEKLRPNFFFLLFFIIPMFILLLTRALGFDGLYGMDSFEYYRFTKELKSVFTDGGELSPFFWPQGFPTLVFIFSFLFKVSFAGQLVSCLCLSGLTYYSYKILNELYPKKPLAKTYILLTVALSPYLVRTGIQFMSDIPSVFCFIACLYYTMRYFKEQNFSNLVLCSFFASYGVFIRFGVGIPLIPIFLSICYFLFKKRNWVHFFAVFPAVIIFAFYQFLQEDISEVFEHHFVDEWSIQNFFKTTFTSDEKHNLASFTYSFPNIIYYTSKLFHPGFFILNIPLFIIWILRKSKLKQPKALLLVYIVVINILFLAGVTVQIERYLFLSYPVLMILLFPAFLVLFNKVKSYQKTIFVFLFSIQLGLSARTIYPSFSRNLLEKEIANELKKQPKNTLYIFEMDLAMQQRGLDFNYENMWFKEYESFDKGSLVLFNQEKFSARFMNKPPMNNWLKLKQENSLIEIMSFDKGWKLYRVE